jgi:hypothetical protein
MNLAIAYSRKLREGCQLWWWPARISDRALRPCMLQWVLAQIARATTDFIHVESLFMTNSIW